MFVLYRREETGVEAEETLLREEMSRSAEELYKTSDYYIL